MRKLNTVRKPFRATEWSGCKIKYTKIDQTIQIQNSDKANYDTNYGYYDDAKAGTAYPSGAPEFTPGFSGVHVTRSLVLNVCLVDRCLSFYPFRLTSALFVLQLLWFTDSPLWYLRTLLFLQYIAKINWICLKILILKVVKESEQEVKQW